MASMAKHRNATAGYRHLAEVERAARASDPAAHHDHASLGRPKFSEVRQFIKAIEQQLKLARFSAAKKANPFLAIRVFEVGHG
jgi:hypothetical protein